MDPKDKTEDPSSLDDSRSVESGSSDGANGVRPTPLSAMTKLFSRNVSAMSPSRNGADKDKKKLFSMFTRAQTAEVDEDEVEDVDEIGAYKLLVRKQVEQINELLEEKDKQEGELKRLNKKLTSIEKERDAKREKEKAAKKESLAASTERKDLKRENENLHIKLQQMLDRVAYQHVEHIEQENRRFKRDNMKLLEDITTLKQGKLGAEEESVQLRMQNEDLEAQMSTHLSTLKHFEKELVEAQKQMEQWKESSILICSKRDELLREMKLLRSKLEDEENAFQARLQSHVDKLKRQYTSKASVLDGKIDDLEAERNRWRSTAKSLQKDLQQLAKSGKISVNGNDSMEDVVAQNRRLEEELARRTASLENALHALQFQGAEDADVAPDVGKTKLAAVEKHARELNAEVLALRSLSNQLTETVKEKDTHINELRESNRMLGMRITEFEEALKTMNKPFPQPAVLDDEKSEQLYAELP